LALFRADVCFVLERESNNFNVNYLYSIYKMEARTRVKAGVITHQNSNSNEVKANFSRVLMT